MKQSVAILKVIKQVTLAMFLATLCCIVKGEDKVRIAEIVVTINPIFSEEERTGWLYETADQIHIDTRPYVISRLLPFKEGDLVSVRTIDEAERILRAKAFLRDAKVTWRKSETGDGVIVEVQTWENWTLVPTVDISREGGVTDYSYGIQDENLLGHGLRATILYFKEQERTGYSLVLASQVSTESHLQAALVLSDTSDGEQYSLGLNKPFYTLDDEWSANFYINTERREDTIYSNDEEVNVFGHEIDHFELSYGFSEGLVDDRTVRYEVGYTERKDSFIEKLMTIGLPEERDFTHPWFGIEYIDDNFIKTKNLYLIGRTEDVQLGWSHNLRLGVNTSNSKYQKAMHWRWDSRYTNQINQEHLYTTWLSSDGVEPDGSVETTYYYSTGLEYFHHASDTRIWYLKAQYWGAENPFIDRPIAIGGESGLRGYPLQYQHGKQAYLANLEKRYYPGINLFKLVDVGFAGFVDVGRARGETLYPNQEEGTLIGVGLGIRLFFSRSSGRNLVNINLAAPVNSDYLSGVDFSITATTSF
ncbi:BamA/TamA family outer membrane protein [Kangiella sp. M94]